MSGYTSRTAPTRTCCVQGCQRLDICGIGEEPSTPICYGHVAELDAYLAAIRPRYDNWEAEFGRMREWIQSQNQQQAKRGAG